MTCRTSCRVLALLSLCVLTFGLVCGSPRRARAEDPPSGASGGGTKDAAPTSSESKPWYAAQLSKLSYAEYEDTLLRFLDKHPKLRDEILMSQDPVFGPFADYVNRKSRKLIIYIPRAEAFDPEGQVTPSGRLAVLKLKNGKIPVEALKGDMVTVIVTLFQQETGAQETSTWKTVAGAKRDLRVQLTVTRGGRAFQPGTAVASASLVHENRAGGIVFQTSWKREVTLNLKK